jgi:hypothetical protein
MGLAAKREDAKMKTTTGTDCGKGHMPEAITPDTLPLTIHGKRYTVCTHKVGHTYCGALVNVTTDMGIHRCCGKASNHQPPDALEEAWHS